VRPPSKATPAKPVTKSIASLGSVLSPEVISNIERAFLSPYYLAMSKTEKEQASNSPLLGEDQTAALLSGRQLDPGEPAADN